ncbi:MAG TPA: carboxypeptidase regulatory-like domain-containing protein [Gemmatimonadaceae bacterium]|nr:carboxypeptidase regulatory-like domain-containing protein [Gemmatimonadaceae bacterium]
MNGIVLDAARAPISDAQLRMQTGGDSTRMVRTGPDGRFAFADVPPGEARLSVKRLGYAPRSLQLAVLPEDSETRPLEIALDAIPAALGDLVVIGRHSRLQEFDERRTRHSSGQFMTGDEIRSLNPRFSSDLFRRVAGASVRGGHFGSTIRLRGCRPKLWIDGVPVRDAELDEVVNPSEIAGLEIYASTAGIPPEYMDREPRPCGVIVVWTRIE